jgi:FkbM family methyltransferase
VLSRAGGRLPWHLRKAMRLRFALREQLKLTVTVPDGERQYRFVCGSEESLRRARAALTKEPGTVAWLRRDLRPGDVFLDVGANIGIYTVLAAHLVAAEGRVVAVEPHLPNAVRLLENIDANGLGERVSVLATALSDAPRFESFNYSDWEEASSSSQLGRVLDHTGKPFQPTARELKPATSIDALIEAGAIPVPDVVKIDVDGLEPPIVAGMRALLAGPHPPRAIQVEMEPDTLAPIEARLAAAGYRIDHRHYSDGVARRIAKGAAPPSVPHNVVFVRG